MTNPNVPPVPTLEETETALANLNPRTARILRARMGLASVEPAPEPPKVEPPAPPSLGLDPAARAIDPEALQRLDGEIAEKDRAKAEQKAAEEAKRAEAARRESEAVAAALEPIKVRARNVSPVLRRREEAVVRIRAELPDRFLYQHSIFCQTVLPYRDPGSDIRKWERVQGEASLLLEAGYIRGEDGHFIPVSLPFGVYARRSLLYLNTTAMKTRNRVIDVDGGVTAFTRRILNRDPNGREIHQSKDAMTRLVVSNVTLAYGAGPRTVQVNAHVVIGFDLWEEHHETERCVTPKTVMLSADYFEDLMVHAVPLDERAIAGLANSPMALDVYTWVTQRAHRIDPQRPQFITWVALYDQFGQGYKNIRQFRADFRRVLNLVNRHYPQLNAKTDKGGILLAYSPPPVPPQSTLYLPSDKPPKE